LVFLLLSMALCLIFFISFGRVNTRGIVTGLFFNSYYVYFFWVLILPTVYTAICPEAVVKRPDGKLLRAAVYFLCAAMILVNAVSIYNVNRKIARLDHSRRVFLDSATAFVRSHASGKDFTFFVPHTCPGNYAGKWLRRNGDPLWRRYTLAEALYPRYYTGHDPQYVLLCESER